MKKLKLYLFALILCFPVFSLQAQTITQSGVRLSSVEVDRLGDDMIINMSLSAINANLSSQEMLILTPEIRNINNMVVHTFAPIVIVGGTREKALNRAISFGTYEFPNPPQMIVKHNVVENVPVRLSLLYTQELHNARLVVNEERYGCACENEYNNQYELLNPILPPLFYPEYRVSYITPPVEEVKRRSETYSARLNFVVNRYEILRDFSNNAAVLAEVDKIVRELQNDKNLTISEFSVTGYASPEGNYNSNMKLSENRAKSFVNYLNTTYGIDPSMIKVDWKGEDWEGLRKVVQESLLASKDEILSIIDSESDIPTRERRLKQLSGGETYRMLLHDYYPPLRRNEYTISYIARNFDINEAKEQIRIKPSLLSLNEMFIVANSYPKNSKEFKETFDIAARIYPDDPVAQLNTATSILENGDADQAIQKLAGINSPEAWNNLGIAYTQKEDYDKAKEYFQRASNAGLKIASENASQLSQWLATQF